jgi:hypothetical protein
VALTPPAADRPPGQEGSVDLLAAMPQLGCPHHLPGGIVDQRQPARPAAWVELDAEGRRRLRL